MDSHANGHANGHGADESFVGHEAVGVSADPDDDKALNGERFATVGEWLAARRRALGLALEEVEHATRVREDYLAAIEDMDPRRMPAGPYAPGFVRTYAIHLELDPEAVAARFREEMSPRRLRTPTTVQEREPLRLNVSPRVWTALLGVLVLAALVAFGWRPRGGEDLLRVPAVPEGLADWVAADVQSRRTSAAPELVVGPDLALRARVPVWFEARVPDGEVLISRTLDVGEIWTAPRVQGVLVSTDNGAGVEILLDGRPQGRLGNAGLPVTGWRADVARGFTPLPPEEEVIAAVAAEAAPLEQAAEPEPEPVAEETVQVLSDLVAEETLVTPDLPASIEIVAEPLPPLVIGQGSFIPDPDETAAAEGRAIDPERLSGADAPDAE
jgi:hypothetical protein